ncbi:flagellar motor switch protein FliG [Specibacter sp. RAF43]|uniref:flagellar motor switch protein FliG n=1 Tax=Specibacter sp. RAF43 TaxID=3233057 RepID=UPI003F9DB339
MNDGTNLNGLQKAAALLMQLSQTSAASVMAYLSEPEAEAVASEIVKMRRVHPDIADAVIDEFHDLVVSGRHAALGGRDFAAGLLEASFGAERAAGVMNRLSTKLAGKPFEFLDDADAGQLVSLLDGEMPTTIALVLAHMRPDRASEALTGLAGDVRTDVAQAIATMGPATPESVVILAETLKQRALTVVGPRDKVAVIGGIQPLVDIINRSDAATERAILEDLELRDPDLAEEVRSRMLTFMDLVKLDAQDVQKVLRGKEAGILALAMKGAPVTVQDVIRANISERNRDLLDFEIESVGPVRASDVEQAQADIGRIIRELEEAGEISVRRGDAEDDAYVY